MALECGGTTPLLCSYRRHVAGCESDIIHIVDVPGVVSAFANYALVQFDVPVIHVFGLESL